MKQYNNLMEILKDKDNYPSAGRVFIERNKKNDLKNSCFWILTSKEIKEQDFIEDEHNRRIPISLKDFNVKSFLDVQTFQDIIILKLEKNPNLSLDQVDIFLEAIMYYLEHDDFLE